MRREDSESLPRSLANALDALADETARSVVPDRVEAAALAAFREAHSARTKPSGTATVVALRRPARTAWLAAAAAVLVAVVGVTAWVRSGSSPNLPAPTVAEAPRETAVTPPPPGLPAVTTPGPTEEVSPASAAWRGGRTSRVQSVHNTTPPRQTPANRQPYEVATEYYPLVAGADLAAMDGGQVVRMRVPRASLASYGFQLDAGRADDDVTADVVMGNDGIARAIRFVQTFDTAER